MTDGRGEKKLKEREKSFSVNLASIEIPSFVQYINRALIQ